MAADLWLLNSCTVKSPAEDHFRNAVQEGQWLGKFMVLAGCVPQSQPKSNYIEVLIVVLHVCSVLVKSYPLVFAMTVSHID